MSDNLLPQLAPKLFDKFSAASNTGMYIKGKPNFTIKSGLPPSLDNPLENEKTSISSTREGTRIKFTTSERNIGFRLINGAGIWEM